MQAAFGREETDQFFATVQIPRIVLEVDDGSVEKLRTQPREYSPARVRENEKILFDEVLIKIRGAAGSFREFDDWPSFTIKMDKGDKDQKFHGLRKVHLNKSLQDASLCSELVGSEICRSAGSAAQRSSPLDGGPLLPAIASFSSRAPRA